MRRSLLCFICIMLSIMSAYGQAVRTPVSASFTRLNTYTSRHVNAFSFGANQAALASIKQFSAAIYNERKFLLKELSLYSAAFALPALSGSFGVKGDYFGDPSYNEAGLGLAYGRKLNDKVDVGVQFNYYSFRVAGYGGASAINAEGGMMIHLTEDLNAGFHIYNPTGVAIGNAKKEKLPSIYSAGFGYDVSEIFFISADVEKIENEPINLNAGLQYYFAEKLWANVGIASAASTYYLGFGVGLQHIRLNVVASIHPQLGITPGLMLLFKTSNKSE